MIFVLCEGVSAAAGARESSLAYAAADRLSGHTGIDDGHAESDQ